MVVIEMAKSVSRYKLVFHYNNGGTRDFTFFGENGEVRNKFTLTEIDVFTSNFSSSDEMARALNSVFPGYKDGYFDIEYSAGGSVKPLELIFKDMTFIRALALDNIRKSVVPKQAIMSYMRRFLADIKDNPEFLKFLFERRYTNKYFRDALSYYLVLKNSDDNDAQRVIWQAEAKLCKEFCRYKTIRGIEVGRRNYEILSRSKDDPSVAKLLNSKVNTKILNRSKDEPSVAFDMRAEGAKVEKRSSNLKLKKQKLGDGQMALFDASIYNEPTVKRTK